MNLNDLGGLLASNCPIQHVPYEVLFKSAGTLIGCVFMHDPWGNKII